MTSFTTVRKRDGRVVAWDDSRIENAIQKAMVVAQEGTSRDPGRLMRKVKKSLEKQFITEDPIHIEDIQDEVERALILEDFAKAAKEYILYREQRHRVRAHTHTVPKHIEELAQKSKKYFHNSFSEFIYYRTYSRWIDEEGRRETWVETVDRYISFMRENIGDKLTENEYDEVREAILNQEVMPSMRLMWGAGKAARKTNVVGYNCAFIAPTKLKDFAEIMYLSMCGTGVGFSVENKIIQQLPLIKEQTGKKLPTHSIEDSKEGWADSLTLGLTTWYAGEDIAFDYSLLRPAGARLYTMGGRSSGPEPLRSLLDFARERILSRQGRRLSALDVHDIVCKIGEIVVAGGVRRSALISLSDLDEEDMRHAKDGQFWISNPQRSMANNSAVYTKKPKASEFLKEWSALIEGQTGERGVFNRGGLNSQVPKRRMRKLQKYLDTMGTNPCGEITLRSKQFCNLSEVVCRREDTRDSLLRKVRLATILGTYQSTLTYFPYLSRQWKKNCEEERLLGVSLTGQWDSPAVHDPEVLKDLQSEAVKANRKYAKRFGINTSTSITCVKPSGTVSQLVDAASGMHPRHSQYYIRRVRISATDPLFHMLKDQKLPYKPEVGQSPDSATTFVLEFPVKAPDNTVTQNDLTAINQLNHWKMVKEHYTEHNPSVTVSIGEAEWLEVANWLYSNWDMIGGLSFLPKTDYQYQLAPYEEITKEKYEEMVALLPKIDFAHIVSYEQDDATQGAKEFACVGGACEVDDMSSVEQDQTVSVSA
ncbi:MAG: ribonucleoside-triphosphate reductase [Candidatus Spechtbacteria bacterium SB0662_bin_43]|uniref:Ribonucleoside-triphosphate reductase n=1 Tax=Candidatus Spechtbacteria bacterium SB0662_bin_43 TaxID=2604897 RepID=A0A845DAJ4_9BACT|nr:ribonucleoside-triphosphate reductase [Candidatus Spechtbacteria bacterium SB0662_bin_43]